MADNNIIYSTQQRPASQAITASALQQSALLIRKRALYNEIDNLRRRIINLNNELAVVDNELSIAHTRVITARERTDDLRERLIIATEQVTQQLMQGNAGTEYIEARRIYDEYRRNNPTDRDGIIRLYDEYTRLHNIIIANREELIRQLIAEINNAVQSSRQSNTSYDNILLRRRNLIQEITDLQIRLDELVDQDRQLNLARGIKRKRHTRHKKGKTNKKGGAWSLKYKRAINCKHPRGFSQKQYCKYGKK